MNGPIYEHDSIEEERMRRARATWRGAEPAPFEIAVAQKRIAAGSRGRVTRSIWYLVVPTVAAAALLVAYLTRHRAPQIAPVSERAPAPAILEPAAPPDAAALDAAARDQSRLAAAEAQHRAGQCRAAKPVLVELAANGATPDVRARAQGLLDEIARMSSPPDLLLPPPAPAQLLSSSSDTMSSRSSARRVPGRGRHFTL